LFPTAGDPPQPVHGGGGYDGAVMVLDLLPSPVVRYGAHGPACRAPLYSQVNGQPWPGNPDFEAHCNRAPANAAGAVFLGLPRPGGGPSILGLVPYVSPLVPGVSVQSNGCGFARAGFPIPASVQLPLGLGLQWVWLNSNGCGNALLSGSDALRM
jgi:hypothetical protein